MNIMKIFRKKQSPDLIQILESERKRIIGMIELFESEKEYIELFSEIIQKGIDNIPLDKLAEFEDDVIKHYKKHNWR
jgi:hypothetical protein